MANSASHAALPFPVKNARYTILVPYLSTTGVPTDPTSPDTEFSGDAGNFADCAEETTTITGSNGTGYITLTGAETNYSMVAIAAKATGVDATIFTIYPRVLPIVVSGTASAGAAGSITLAAGSYDLTGCIVRTTGGTGGGGTGGANNQARVISAYNIATKVASVIPNWETNPSSDTTYDILLTDMASTPVAPQAAVIDSGTAQSVTGTTIVLRSAFTAAADSNIVGATVWISGATNGIFQSRTITGYVESTKTCTVDTWTQTPTGTITYVIFPTPPAVTATASLPAVTLAAVASAALTESYGTDGSALTLNQILYLILSRLTEFSTSGTTITSKKLDGSTTAATYTLDSASAPTSITRAS